jgi:hypothetical protein
VEPQGAHRLSSNYDQLIARGKKPKQALVAVMRKLLHSIHGMLSNGSDGERFRALPQGA